MKDKEFEIESDSFVADTIWHDLEYIGAPCGTEDNGVKITMRREFCGAGYRPGIGMYEYLNDDDLYNKGCSKLSNISINKGQDEMFSFYSPYSKAASNYNALIQNGTLTPKQAVENILGNKKSYRPLPDSLTIKESSIDGLGLFAVKHIHLLDVRDPYEWMTHVFLTINKDNQPIRQLFRTPVGGFINHSINPNCTIGKISQVSANDFTTEKYFLRPLRDIEAGEEITVDYKKELCGLSGYDDAEFLKDNLEDVVYENSVGAKYFYNSTLSKYETSNPLSVGGSHYPIFYTPEDAEKFLKRVK